MTFLKQNWFKLVLGMIVLGFFTSPFQVSAHRSGCHRWHSCPSDSGSYSCGDAGHPCQYPTYPKSGGVIYPPSGYYKDCYDCAIKKVPANAFTTTIDKIGFTCSDGYSKSGNSCVKVIKIPANAHAINDGKNVWLCNNGYIEKGNSCIVQPSQSLTPTPMNNETTQAGLKKSFWNKLKFW